MDGKSGWSAKVQGDHEERIGEVDPTKGVLIGLEVGSSTIGLSCHLRFQRHFVRAFGVERGAMNGVADRTHRCGGAWMHFAGEHHRKAVCGWDERSGPAEIHQVLPRIEIEMTTHRCVVQPGVVSFAVLVGSLLLGANAACQFMRELQHVIHTQVVVYFESGKHLRTHTQIRAHVRNKS